VLACLRASPRSRVRSNPMARNLECKARDPEPQATLHAALALGASDEGVLWQRDTYFAVDDGRLKVREQHGLGGGGSGESAELIHYRRADTPAQRESAYRIVAVTDPAGLTAVLGDALGVTEVVTKQRHLLLWQRVRIHLDEVEQLGAFVELEAVLADDEAPADAQDRVTRLREVLGIVDGRLEPRGYAALLGARR
jgi:adenylate cyclase class 2